MLGETEKLNSFSYEIQESPKEKHKNIFCIDTYGIGFDSSSIPDKDGAVNLCLRS
ncbi:MAG: hypothetical protein ACP5KL_00665 [Thermoplasmata archaeon]|jgi:hypothetical protein